MNHIAGQSSLRTQHMTLSPFSVFLLFIVHLLPNILDILKLWKQLLYLSPDFLFECLSISYFCFLFTWFYFLLLWWYFLWWWDAVVCPNIEKGMFVTGEHGSQCHKPLSHLRCCCFKEKMNKVTDSWYCSTFFVFSFSLSVSVLFKIRVFHHSKLNESVRRKTSHVSPKFWCFIEWN